MGDPACLDSSKWFSQGILGQILESIRDEVIASRSQSYQLPPPTLTAANQQCPSNASALQSTATTGLSYPGITPQSIVHHSVNQSYIPSVISEPQPIPSVAQTDRSLEIISTTSSSASVSASTTPVSDTTASDTDNNEISTQHNRLNSKRLLKKTLS